MTDDGWFKLYRGWRSNPLFEGDPLSKGEAWLWLIENAAHKATRFNASGTFVPIERGQLGTSIRRLAKAWIWPKSNVERFLGRLKAGTGDGPMIETDSGTGQLIITICNYRKYQDSRSSGGTAGGTQHGTSAGAAPGQQRDTKEEAKNLLPYGRGEEPPAPMDLKKMVFDGGRQLLIASGHSAAEAGKMIGNLRRDYSDAAILDVLARCQVEQPEVPFPWIKASLQSAGASRPRRSHDDRGGAPNGYVPRREHSEEELAAARERATTHQNWIERGELPA